MTTLARIGDTGRGAPAPAPWGAPRLLLCLLTLLTLPLAGCAEAAEDSPRLELFTWWRQDSEVRALEKVLATYRADGGDIDFDLSRDGDADAVRELLTARMLAGAPPSTYHANVGADLLRWAVVDTTGDELPSQRKIRGLGEFFDEFLPPDVLPAELLSGLRVGDDLEPFAVPINIHRLNVLFYNEQRRQAFAEGHEQLSFLDLSVLCPENLQANLVSPDYGPDFVIAIGTDPTFPLTLLVFENLLPALGGPELYDALFRGNAASWRSPTGETWDVPVRKVLLCAQYLSRGFLATSTWDDAAIEVIDGKDADFTVMGDWAQGALAEDLKNGTVAAVPFPGSDDSFVFTSDTFPLPVDAPHQDEILKLLQVIASREGQLTFSREKRSIPARTDVDLEQLYAPEQRVLEEYAKRTHDDFVSVDVRRVLATSGLLPTYYPGDALVARLQAVTASNASPEALEKAIEDAIAFLRTTTPLLQRWQTRLHQPSSPGPAP